MGVESPTVVAAGIASSSDRHARNKRRVFRVLAILFGLLTLIVLEFALRMAGVGRDLRLVVPTSEASTILTHQLNPSVDLAYYGNNDVFGPEPRRFDMPKPADTFRIVFLGESTVIGFPYAPEVAFPRHVELLLQRQSPDTKFEVLNAGVTGINSFGVADLAAQCLACDPDVIVIHCGHNEFYGPGGPASTVLSLPPPLVRAAIALRRLRTVQLLSSLAPGTEPVQKDLFEVLPRTLEIPLGSDGYHQAEQNLETNLERAVATTRAAGVPVVLSTMASNLRDQGPLRAGWPDGSPEERRAEWEALLTRAEESLASGDGNAALAELVQAESICGTHARLQYRTGQCLSLLGRTRDAKSAFIAARDLDLCRYRAPSSFSEITRNVALRNREGVCFVDVPAALDDAAHPTGPGNELFLEHVHYTFEGHRRLGKLFARTVQEQVRGIPWDASRDPDDVTLRATLGFIPEDELAAASFSLQIVKTGPLRGALDGPQREKLLVDRISTVYAELPAARRSVFAELPMNRMMTDLVGGLAELHAFRGEWETALNLSELATRRCPWSPAAHLTLARARWRVGDWAGARQSAESAAALHPESPPTQVLLRLIEGGGYEDTAELGGAYGVGPRPARN